MHRVHYRRQHTIVLCISIMLTTFFFLCWCPQLLFVVEGFTLFTTITTSSFAIAAPHLRKLRAVGYSSSSSSSSSSNSIRTKNNNILHMSVIDDDDDVDVNKESKATTTTTTTTIIINELMAKHDPILLFASKLLPKDKALDASVLYAWCRRLDEICDNEENNNANNHELVRNQLDTWQTRFDELWIIQEEEEKEEYGGGGGGKDKIYNSDDDTTTTSYYTDNDEYLMDLALKDCIERYQNNNNNSDGDGDIGSNSNNSLLSSPLLTRKPFDDMIEGMKSDAVEKRRVKDMAELELYAYQVAGTVGLMLLPLLLSSSSSSNNQNNNNNNNNIAIQIERATEPAICLGKAIQLVNILRDATQDAKLGRIYLPQDMLQEEGVSDDDILLVVLSGGTGTSTGTGNTGEPPAAASDGYKRVVKRVSQRAHELLTQAEEGGKSTLPPPLGPLFVQIIVELYRDYLEELKRRDYDNLTSTTTISNNNDDDDDGGRVKISTLRKIQASLRAVVKVLF